MSFKDNYNETYEKLSQMKLDNGSTLTIKYKILKYNELKTLLELIRDGKVKRYDFESLFNHSHRYDDSLLEFIPCFARALYSFFLKDYKNFLKHFSIVMNSFEPDDEKIETKDTRMDKKVSKDTHFVFQNLDNPNLIEKIPLLSIALYILHKMGLTNLTKMNKIRENTKENEDQIMGNGEEERKLESKKILTFFKKLKRNT